MLRSLIRSFQRNVVINLNNSSAISSFPKQTQQLRSISEIVKDEEFKETDAAVEESLPTTSETTEQTTQDTDPGYIVPYRFEHESRRSNGQKIIEALQTRLRLSNSDVKKILSDEPVKSLYKERSLSLTLEKLCQYGISKKCFMEFPWLLTIDPNTIEEKLEAIKKIQLHDINHFVPFLRLSTRRLKKLMSSLKNEAYCIPQGNRVYYISDKLAVDPSVVSKYLSHRLFILQMPFDMCQQNLQHMINYEVDSLNILKDLWAFRYTPKSIQKRFERAKIANKDKIMPWMVRCPETILQRSLKLATDEVEILGDKTSVVEYVAERLKFDVDVTKAIMDKHPAVLRVRVKKIKEVLDYLLNEAGFTETEIAQVPRIMCHGLETTKKRIEELKSYGCRPSSLVIVCRSKREYQKFVVSWLGFKNTTNSSEENTSKVNNLS